jgi:hypothetical protein
MHHLITIVLLAAAAQDPVEIAMPLGRVEETLRSEPSLLYHHQGYVAYLASHPKIAEAEKAYTELTQLADFRRVTAAFDEALLADSKARMAFERYYTFLADYPDSRRSVDALFRVEFDSTRGMDTLSQAFSYMRAHPDLALRFLAEPDRMIPTPDQLNGARRYFGDHTEVRDEVRGILLGIHDQGLAHVSVFPWWSMAGQENGKVASAHGGLMAYLSANPHKFWVWHRRQTAIATDPKAQKWIPYWFGRVRRHPELKYTYWHYLRTLRAQPLSVPRVGVPGDTRERRKPWPPEGEPPQLPPMKPGKTGKQDPLSREALMPEPVERPTGPDLPSVARPETPTMPTSPDEPAAPSESSSILDVKPRVRERRPSRIVAPVEPTPPTPPTPPRKKETSAEGESEPAARLRDD